MKLHTNTKLFKEAVSLTAQGLNVPPEYIEKDYWVSYALYTIFNNDIVGAYTVFKGGTALSKCNDIIKRFSEDIDLVVIRNGDENPNQLKRKIKKITSVVSEIMPEVSVEGITIKLGMSRKTGHEYPKLFKGNYGQVRDVIIVEATWLGYFEPYSETTISSYIYDMMLSTGQGAMAIEYDLTPFRVQVLDPRRTICEKIMSLVRFSYADDPIGDLRKKVRHTYDLHQLLQQEELKEFFESDDFDSMLLRVAQDDVASFKNNNAWLEYHPRECKFFAELELVWEDLSKVYDQSFRGLVYGDFPEPPVILSSMKRIKKRIAHIPWEINFEN